MLVFDKKFSYIFTFFYRNIDWGCNTQHLKPGNSGGLWFKIFLWNEWSLAARRKLINYTRNTGVWRIFGPRNKFIRWTFSSLRLFVVKTWISGGIFEWLIRSISRNWESWNLSKVWFSSRSWVSFVVGMTVQQRECIKLNQPFKQGIFRFIESMCASYLGLLWMTN